MPLLVTSPTDGPLDNPDLRLYRYMEESIRKGRSCHCRVIHDFDLESLALALHQEWIEVCLFHDGLAKFSVLDFDAAGLSAADRFLLRLWPTKELSTRP